jgi:hypothetical protein
VAAQPQPRLDDAPIDRRAVELRYRYHRAQRHARLLRREETRLARYRFYVAMTVLLAIAGGFVVAAWHEVQRLFGI